MDVNEQARRIANQYADRIDLPLIEAQRPDVAQLITDAIERSALRLSPLRPF